MILLIIRKKKYAQCVSERGKIEYRPNMRHYTHKVVVLRLEPTNSRLVGTGSTKKLETC